MADDITDGTELPAGQPTDGLPAMEIPGSGNQGNEGEPPVQTTQPGTDEDVIFDPSEYDRMTDALPEDLKVQANALRKSLQGDYSKKTQELSGSRQKVEAYDTLMKDPIAAIHNYAKQYGLTVNGPGQQPGQEEFDPQSWDDVTQKVVKAVEAKFAPMVNELQNLKRSSAETTLNKIDPSWKTYQGEMMQNLRAYPGLANDPAALYKLSVPDNVLASRATQAALKKLEAKGKSSKIASGSTTTRTPAAEPSENMSFAQAVQFAKEKLKAEGKGPGL